jgi:hypothetical protein
MASVSQSGYVGLNVRYPNQWKRFAAQVPGLQPGRREPDDSLFPRMDEYHHRFILHPTGKDGLACIGWEVATEETLAAMAEQLRRSAAHSHKLLNQIF